MDKVESILADLLESIGVTHQGLQKSEIAGQSVISITTNEPQLLIGQRGDTIHAIDHLVKKIAENRSPKLEEGAAHDLVLIDVNEYRTKQIKDLQTKALMMAERARSFQYDVELSPMSSYERLIIHTTLQDQPNVKTESLGEGRNRRVVIKYSAE